MSNNWNQALVTRSAKGLFDLTSGDTVMMNLVDGSLSGSSSKQETGFHGFLIAP